MFKLEVLIIISSFLMSGCSHPSETGQGSAGSGIGQKNDSVTSKEISRDSLLLPLKDNVACLYGFTDRKGNWVIQPSFTSVYSFYRGNCIVENGDNYGVIDYTGKFLVPMHPYEFEWVTEFKNNYAVIEKDNKKGIFCQNGEIVLQPKYPAIYFIRKSILYRMQEEVGDTLNEADLQRGLFRYWDKGEVGLLDSMGKIALPAEYDKIDDIETGVAVTHKGGKEGLVNDEGKMVLPAVCDNIGDFEYHYTFDYEINGKKGLADHDHKITDALYDEVQLDGINYHAVKKNGKWGMVDGTGMQRVELKFEALSAWTKNKVFASVNSKYGILDLKSGKIISEPVYEEIWVDRIYENKNVFIKKNGKWGMMDSTAKIIIPCNYDDYYWNGRYYLCFTWADHADFYSVEHNYLKILPSEMCQKGYHVFKTGQFSSDHEGLVREDGTVLLKPEFNIEWYEYKELFVGSDGKGKNFVFDKNGNELKNFSRFVSLGSFNDDYVYVQSKSGHSGICDLKGNLVIDTIYWAVSVYNEEEDCAWVVPKSPPLKNKDPKYPDYDFTNLKFSLVSPKGKILLPPTYDAPAPVEDGKLVIMKNGKWGFIEKQGKPLLPFDYDMIWWDNCGSLILYKNGKYGLAASSGKILLQPAYQYIGSFANGYARIENETGQGLIDKNGKFIVPIGKDALIYAKNDLLALMKLESDNNYDFNALDSIRDQRHKILIKNYCFEFKSRSLPLPDSYNVASHLDYDLFHDGRLEIDEITRNQMSAMSSEDARKAKLEWCAGKMFAVNRQEKYFDNDEVENNEHLVFEIQKEKLVKLTLDSIFEVRSKYAQAINQLLLQKIRYDKGFNFECANPEAVFDTVRESFSISKQGMTFYFRNEDHEEIKVYFTFTELKKYLKKNGPVARLMAWK